MPVDSAFFGVKALTGRQTQSSRGDPWIQRLFHKAGCGYYEDDSVAKGEPLKVALTRLDTRK
jgi:hypothetical protein